MANQEHLDILKQGVKIWNQWRKEHADVKPDLSSPRLQRTYLQNANLSGAYLVGTDLSYAHLRGVLLIQTNLPGATLTQCSIYGISAWNVQLEGAKQDNLVITDSNEPTITLDNLKVAQFVYLLLNHQELRGILNSVMERGVLLLGRFGGGGLELLQAIAEKLRELENLPIIFDFEKPDSRDFTETIITLPGLSKFMLVDLSGPSVPNELRATIPHFNIPFVPII